MIDFVGRLRAWERYGVNGEVFGEAADVVDELLAALDDMDASLRAGDTQRLVKCAFVWGQRRDRILAGEETWADQKIGPPTFGGKS